MQLSFASLLLMLMQALSVATVPVETRLDVAENAVGSEALRDIARSEAPNEQRDAVDNQTWRTRVARISQYLYETGPLRSGLQGSAQFRVELDADGRVAACTVSQSSSSVELDAIGCPSVVRAGRVPAEVMAMLPPGERRFVLPLRWIEGDRLALDEGKP